MRNEGVQTASAIISMITNIIFVVFLIFSFFGIKSLLKSDSEELQKLLEEKKNDVTKEVYDFFYEKISKGSTFDENDEKHFKYVINLPFKKSQKENNDIKEIIKFLDQKFIGLEEAKEGFTNYLIEKKFKLNSCKNLLLYGCPGNGKTSFAKAIAEAMNRKFITISFAGAEDVSLLYGHKKTFIGSTAGQLINEIKKSGCNNPVILLDEIDKIGKLKGYSPVTDALLYILDPVSNQKFRDHYVDFNFDLSHVFFIATANYFDNISAPLKDRFQCLKVENYSSNEMNLIFDRVIGPRLIKEINDNNSNRYSKVKFEQNFFADLFNNKFDNKKCFKTDSSCYKITNRQIEVTAKDILAHFLYHDYQDNTYIITKNNEYVVKQIRRLQRKYCNN